MDSEKNISEPITESVVLHYLEENPQFFSKNGDFLSELVFNHDSGEATSLIERQVASLRKKNQTTQSQLFALVKIAKENDKLFSKIKSFSLELFEIESWKGLNETLATHFLTDFKADFISCRVTSKTEGLMLDHIKFGEQVFAQNLISNSSPTCTQLRSHQMKQLFGDAHNSDESVQSAILLPLLYQEGSGILSIGSRDPERFNDKMDTMFVAFVADLLGKVVERLCR